MSLQKDWNTQSIALDFLVKDDQFYLVEISYSFPPYDFANHPGYFDKNYEWHDADIIPSIFIIEEFINSLNG